MAEIFSNEVNGWLKKVRRSVSDFAKKDRKKILTKAAKPVTKAAKALAPESEKPHYLGKKPNRIKYNSKNLKRSIANLGLRRTGAVIVGPRFRKKKVMEYGGVGQPTDAYYAAMVYGSAKAFGAKVMAPAAQAARPAVVQIVKTESLRAIVKNAAQRGIDTK